MARTNNQNRSQIGHWEGPKAPPDHRICFICPPSVHAVGSFVQRLSELGGRLASAVRRMHALEPTAWLCVQSMDAEALTRRPEDPEGLCSPGTTIQTYVPSVSQSLLASPLSGQTADGG